ncbi:permease-like cell division protein FtsX [Brassicibacter mesophilus]|uniref:permease-like cell division protein FtsX n=1 Tax=Brassicibacter mesophilus TaxID=745119 RepID=UPI003D1F9B0A
MNFRIFKTMMKQGFVGVWRNRTMSFASVGSVGATLTILGIILILILNINSIANTTKEQFDEIQIYIEKGLKQDEIEKLGEKISGYDGVASVTFQTKEQAMNLMKDNLGEQGYLLEGLEENPLPNSYIIQLSSIESTDNVVNQLKDLDGIERIKYYKDIVDKLIAVTHFVRIGGLLVIAILVFISIFIISNTVKITVTARKREISIMKYVGATNGFIRGPFIVEGIVLGLVGTFLAIVIVYYGYRYLFTAVNERLYVFLTVYMVPPHLLFGDIAIMFIAIGVGIGMLGSIVSLRKFLRV